MVLVIPAILTFLGVGGDHINERILFEKYGDKGMMPYFATLVYISCHDTLEKLQKCQKA